MRASVKETLKYSCLCSLAALAVCFAGTANAERYRIELKAWIPSDYVVDPVPFLGIKHCYAHAADLSWWSCESKFGGDGHTGYAGSYRVVSRVTFDWNGTRVSNLQHQERYGQTTRYHTLHKYPGLGGPTRDSHSRRQDEAAGYERVDASTIRLTYSTRNPMLENLPLAEAPAIDADVEFSMSSYSIRVSGETDNFPSHGVAVYRLTESPYFNYWSLVDSCILRDASGVNQWSALALHNGLTNGQYRSCYLNWNP